MARTKRIPLATEYLGAYDAASASGDSNACFPIAVSLLTGVDISTVRQAFADAGRKDGQATPWGVARVAVESIGYKMERLPIAWKFDKIATYPGVHKKLQNITTRHPVRFAKQWEGESVLFHINGHVAAVVDGRMMDWSSNRSKHVMDVYKLVKL
jgi:hypothetical protein